MVKDHEFRLDLYYRLNTIELSLPPLRQRPTDIPLLATFFLNRYNRQNRCKKHLSSDVLHLFSRYSWPGNVRELQHTIESLVVLCPTDTITPDQLPEDITGGHPDDPLAAPGGLESMTLKESVALLETRMIRAALDTTESAVQAARKLGIDASTLSKKRKRYGL